MEMVDQTLRIEPILVVTQSNRPSHRVIISVSLAGAFFIELLNALVLPLMLQTPIRLLRSLAGAKRSTPDRSSWR